jgi:hypothetical protein
MRFVRGVSLCLVVCSVAFLPSAAVASGGLPTPTSYAQTCKLDIEWCANAPSGRLPTKLRRPLHLPKVRNGACPVSTHVRYQAAGYGGMRFGNGPVTPLLAADGLTPFAKQSVLFRAGVAPGWGYVKTLWFARADYTGPVLIRGRRLDGSGTLALGGGIPRLRDPQLPPGGRRAWPGGTWVRSPGCYAWQIDGTSFSTVIVFRARFG